VLGGRTLRGARERQWTLRGGKGEKKRPFSGTVLGGKRRLKKHRSLGICFFATGRHRGAKTEKNDRSPWDSKGGFTKAFQGRGEKGYYYVKGGTLRGQTKVRTKLIALDSK